MYKVVKNEFGFFSIEPLPSKEDLQKHYSQKYYQEESTQYSHKYSNNELEYFINTAKVTEYIYSKYFSKSKHIEEKKSISVLDLGAGEGFFSNYFLKNNYSVTALDFSDFGIKKHNKEVLPNLVQGDIFESIQDLFVEESKFDIINLSNVLDPRELLTNIKTLLKESSMLRISVPNDYSEYQNFLINKGYTTETWLAPPEHLHYFTFKSLENLLVKLGYKVEISLGEFPIEVFLANESSNYTKNKNVGKFANRSRIEVDNFLFSQGIERYIELYKATANIDFSRQVIIFAKRV
jgi:2-polyprenyl-3-methyl-5-hydroxy-6-metoxy-1,4-benzoquinol methylase